VLKISEVFEKQKPNRQERPDGTKVVYYGRVFETRDVLINRDYIVSIAPHEFTSTIDLERLDTVFPDGTKFSAMVLDGNSFRRSEIIVVGSFEKFCQQLEDKSS